MQRLQGKWVVLIGDEAPLTDNDTVNTQTAARALAAAGPLGIVVTALRGPMTSTFMRAFRTAAPHAPIHAVGFGRNFTTVAAARCVTEWHDYDAGTRGEAATPAKQAVLDGHAVSVARALGPTGILALTRENILRENNLRAAATDWNLMVAVKPLSVPMPF